MRGKSGDIRDCEGGTAAAEDVAKNDKTRAMFRNKKGLLQTFRAVFLLNFRFVCNLFFIDIYHCGENGLEGTETQQEDGSDFVISLIVLSCKRKQHVVQ